MSWLERWRRRRSGGTDARGLDAAAGLADVTRKGAPDPSAASAREGARRTGDGPNVGAPSAGVASSGTIGEPTSEAAAREVTPALLAWLNQPSYRAARRYLEAHPELLGSAAEALLARLRDQNAGNAGALASLSAHQALLDGARARGGTLEAIRATFVDQLGGLTLDVPEWLEAGEREDAALAGTDAAALWRGLRVRAAVEPSLAPEVAAAVATQLWETLYTRPPADEDPVAVAEEARAAEESALPIFARERYPNQWAALRSNLGVTYSTRVAGERAENLEAAIAHLEAALEVYTPERTPGPWAVSRNNLGDAYRQRIRGDHGENLERAIACFEAALSVYGRETAPREWANTKNNLGVAYADRPRGDPAENFEQAIACYSDALAVFDREHFPVAWAMTQNNLGIAYRNRLRGSRGENLERAIACYRAALEVRTRDDLPDDWGVTQNNLGKALADRVAGDHAMNLEEAIACFQRALEVRTRDRDPARWALTEYNLGLALTDRVRGDSSANLDQAIASFEAALTVQTREALPADWASTRVGLGNAYAARTGATQADDLERAIACYHAALAVQTRDADAHQWASAQDRLGLAYTHRARGDRGENLERAIGCLAAALEVRTRDTYADEWAGTQNNLANAYLERVRGDRGENIERAIEGYTAALEVYTRTAAPLDWAMTELNLANGYVERVRGDRGANVEEAIAHANAALEVYTRASTPADWALATQTLGRAYAGRIRGSRSANLERAIAGYTLALEVHTRKAYPIHWALEQVSLGNAYRARIAGERAANIEAAIGCDAGALEVYTHADHPVDWALAQNNLGIAYADRVLGDRGENVERAIACYTAALTVRTREALPGDWAATQLNLGAAYADRARGEPGENIERALACYSGALEVYTRASAPLLWASVQNNLGNALLARVGGDRGENVERAIAAYEAALEVYPRAALPVDWARMWSNLGNVYAGRVRGERRANLERAIAACESALEVYTRADFPQDWALAQLNLGKALVALASAEPAARAEREARGRARYAAALEIFTLDALPHDYRRTQMLVAELEAGRGAWLAAHAAYAAALGAEERLLALSAGASARDAVLREGRETSTRTAFCLAQLGRVDEAVVAAERGRTRGLAEARQVEWADPARIGDRGRRERYIAARDRWVAALAELHRPMAEDAAEEERRAQGLVRAEACRAARGELDAVVAEIRATGDPADFMDDSLDLATLGRAARTGGVGHTLVYLLATPWGGAALAVHAAGDGQTTGHLPLPELTSERVGALLQLELGDGSGRVVGGFGHAQEGRGLSFLEYGWEGASFAAKAANLHVACAALGIASALDRAAAEIQEYPAVGALAAWPLDRETYAQIDPTLEFVYLEHELRRCLPELGALALGPVAGWLGAAGVGGVTLVPCGALAAFPLLAAPVGGGGIAADGVATVERAWRTLGDMLPSTVVPSARALLAEDGHREEGNATTRYGVMALGDPWPTHQPLEWGEAEARTLAALGGNAEGAAIHERATREWLLAALRGAEVVDASCHGEFNATDFLRSRLLLANGATLTLGDILGGASDLRGLRLLILSACQTAILDLRGASDEVRSLAAGMLQAGARAVLGALWSVDDRATYLLMTRFAQEWLPRRHAEPPAGALARAQRWLRTVTAAELRSWQVSVPHVATMPVPDVATMPVALASAGAVRGRGMRYAPGEAGERVAAGAELLDDNACPYADPIYWSAFQISGW